MIGFEAATPLILMGKEVRADKAKKIGLVDLVVDKYALESTAIDHARQVRLPFTVISVFKKQLSVICNITFIQTFPIFFF